MDEAVAPGRVELLDIRAAAGSGAVANMGARLKSCDTTLEMVRRYPWMYGCLGVHPSETAQLTQEGLDWLRQALKSHPRIVAVGEIGLDYYWEEPDHMTQQKWFRSQLDLARELNLPVVIHSRDGAKDTLDIMKEEKAGELGGVIHCFSYSKEMAREYLNMGFYLGIGGVVTFKNAKKLKEVVEYMPLDRLVLETDCPYLAPVPNRGKRNSSLNLPFVVEVISQLKGITAGEVEEAAWENALKLYRIPRTAD